MKADNITHVPTTVTPAHVDIATLIRSRRTIHLFKPDRPPHHILMRALDLARWSPNHRLTEPWRFYLIGPETADAIARLNATLVAEKRGDEAGRKKLDRWRSIPGWLAVTCHASEDPDRAREDYAACCTAIQNMQLYLWSEGIGMKWTTGPVTRHPQFSRLIGIEKPAEHLVGLMWYGYPAQIPDTQRRPLAEVLTALP